jgi:uncharacterized protein YidB (DUF937 family)
VGLLLQEMSARTEVPVAELTSKLAQVLSQAIDQMTPNGAIPNS